MNTSQIELGKQYYSTTLRERVTALSFYGQFVVVEDSRGNHINVSPSRLQSIDWSAEDILEREG